MMKFLHSFGIAATVMCMSVAANAQELPDALYLVGSMNGWSMTPDVKLVETGEEGIYSGVFNVDAGALEFKVFNTEDMDWSNTDSYFGTPEEFFNVFADEPAMVELGSAGDYNFRCDNWLGGEVQIDIDYIEKMVFIYGPGQPALSDVPEALYLVGSMNDWQFTPEYALVEGSEKGVYKGVYNIPADMLEFKIFNTDDMSWDNTDTYFGCVEGKFNVYSDIPGVVTMSSSASSNFNCANWVGGYAVITVNYYKNTVTIEGSDQPAFTEEPPTEESEMYLIGLPQGWNISGSEMPLDKVDGYEGLYYGSYEINAGEAMFRFYTQLGDWENNSIGAQFEDDLVDFEIPSDGVLTTPAVYGKGTWYFQSWNGGIMYILVDVNKMEVSFSNSDFLASVGVNAVEANSLSINMTGDKLMFGCDSEYKIYTIGGALVLSGKGDFASIENLKAGMYVVKATSEGASASLKICR